MVRLKIVVDTNMFMAVHQMKLDIFSEFERIEPSCDIYTISPVVEELKKLSKSKGKDGVAARVGLSLIEKKGINIIECDGNADPCLMEMAKKGYIIATNDVELRKKLKKQKVNTIFVRDKSKLEVG